MRQALHILRKDLRGHWYEIAITIVVTAVFAYTGAMQAAIWRSGAQSRGIAWDLVLLVLPLTWWALIARVIHAEALPGDRQFWLTRPYRRGSLLGAKTLLILLCVNVPMLLASAVIYRPTASQSRRRCRGWRGGKYCSRRFSFCRSPHFLPSRPVLSSWRWLYPPSQWRCCFGGWRHLGSACAASGFRSSGFVRLWNHRGRNGCRRHSDLAVHAPQDRGDPIPGCCRNRPGCRRCRDYLMASGVSNPVGVFQTTFGRTCY